MSQEQHGVSGLQSMRLGVRGTHIRVPRRAMGHWSSFWQQGSEEVSQLSKTHKNTVNKSFWGAQLQAEGVGWTRLLQNHSSCPTLHLNHPALDAACVYSSKPFFPFVRTHHCPQSHKTQHLRMCFILKTFSFDWRDFQHKIYFLKFAGGGMQMFWWSWNAWFTSDDFRWLG